MSIWRSSQEGIKFSRQFLATVARQISTVEIAATSERGGQTDPAPNRQARVRHPLTNFIS